MLNWEKRKSQIDGALHAKAQTQNQVGYRQEAQSRRGCTNYKGCKVAGLMSHQEAQTKVGK